MDNQHRKIKGYRELSEAEIAGMNTMKALEQQVLDALQQAVANGADGRWAAIAKTDLQKGFMAAGRAIARPDGYESVEEREARTAPESEGLQT